MLRYLIFLSFLVSSAWVENEISAPIPKTHSHNDYLHEIPLLDALSHGFISVEADILLKEGQLYVGHDKIDLEQRPLMTLDEFYLKPLFTRFQKYNGYIYPGYEDLFYLWIDIKYAGEEVCRILSEQIKPYLPMIYSPFRNPDGRVMLIISGDRPYDLLLKDDEGYLQIDGRPDDLPSEYPTDRMPVISQNVRAVCAVNPEGFLDDDNFHILLGLVDECHRHNKMIRLWATPDNQEMWSQLLKADVDLINTDSLEALASYLKN